MYVHIRHTTNEVTLYCLSLSISRIAKRVVELGQLPPREILSILRLYFLTIHTLAHGSILSNPLRIRVHTIQCTHARRRGAVPFPAKAVQPTRRAQPREPTSIIRVL
eukprot:COSAG01_NODE_11823_length_1852_cov_175.349686_3_plen_107_part_00